MWQHVWCKDDSTPGLRQVSKEVSAVGMMIVPQIYE